MHISTQTYLLPFSDVYPIVTEYLESLSEIAPISPGEIMVRLLTITEGRYDWGPEMAWNVAHAIATDVMTRHEPSPITNGQDFEHFMAGIAELYEMLLPDLVVMRQRLHLTHLPLEFQSFHGGDIMAMSWICHGYH